MHMLDILSSWSRVRGVVGSLVVFLALPSAVLAADTSLTLPVGRVGVPYAGTVFAQVGQAEPYIWQVSTTTVNDVLPPGITAFLSENRHLGFRGTPTRAGMYQFTAAPFSASGTAMHDVLVTWEIQPVSDAPLIVTGPGARTGVVGRSFSSEPILTVVGGSAPYRWRMVQGGLPAGLRFTADGSLEGVPTVAGQYLFQAELNDVRDMRSTTSVLVSVADAPPHELGQASGDIARVVSVPFIPPSSLSLSDRQSVLRGLQLIANTVIQTAELDPLMQRPTRYYLGTDARRHPFQNDQVYQSWYDALISPRVLSRSEMMSIPFGDAVTYRPGERVRFETDTQTYVVSEPRSLRTLPQDQSGLSWTWQRGVEELDGTVRGAYRAMSEPVTSANYDPAVTRTQYSVPNSIL